MKKIISLFLVIILTLSLAACAAPSASPAEAPAETPQNSQEPQPEREERVLRMDGDNLGYPSIYTSSPKGRGYLLVSFTFDTLVWKDDNGTVPLLANEW
ncbi:MAG TPA: ABC transporter substrate-binding protein, partial [Clostridiales bacterium]|nr:ABC transporter substrate-binding protein [Clostridiales bacterium]